MASESQNRRFAMIVVTDRTWRLAELWETFSRPRSTLPT